MTRIRYTAAKKKAAEGNDTSTIQTEQKRSVAEELAQAKRTSEELAKSTGTLNKKLGGLEKYIVGLELGVVVSMSLAHGHELVLRRGPKGHGLFVDSNDEAYPLLNAPREYRIYAAKMFSYFIEAIHKRCEEELKSIKESNDALDTVFDQLGLDSAVPDQNGGDAGSEQTSNDAPFDDLTEAEFS
jgi:hypothetical protein